MVDLGIGRPSTYASIVSTIQSWQYVRKEKNRLIPEDKGKLISIFLSEYLLNQTNKMLYDDKGQVLKLYQMHW